MLLYSRHWILRSRLTLNQVAIVQPEIEVIIFRFHGLKTCKNSYILTATSLLTLGYIFLLPYLGKVFFLVTCINVHIPFVLASLYLMSGRK